MSALYTCWLPRFSRLSSPTSASRFSSRVRVPAGILDAGRIRLMKPGAVLVNTSRGGIVDEVALCEAIREQRLSGVALDTFAREPLPADSPLRDIPNAIIIPHIVGHTLDAILSLDVNVVENLKRVIAGATPVHVRNPEVRPAWLAKYAAK